MVSLIAKGVLFIFFIFFFKKLKSNNCDLKAQLFNCT